MKPVKFKGCNTVLAKDQPPYLPLPCYSSNDASGLIITCWKMTFKERIKALFTGVIWIGQVTYLEPLQPQRADVRNLMKLYEESK